MGNAAGHDVAHSRVVVKPQPDATKHFDFRISSDQPKGYAAPHKHKIQEQIYHIVQGAGPTGLDCVRHVVRPHDCIFVPPGVEHAIYETGHSDLVLFVATSPPEDAT